MSVFAVIAFEGGKGRPVREAVIEYAPDNNYPIPGAPAWLVVHNGTASELSKRLGVTDGKTSNALVVRVEDYFGRAPRDVWEWIKVKQVGDG